MIRTRKTFCVFVGIASLLLAVGVARAQTPTAFSSTSNGADGAFDFTGTPSGTIMDFDPAAYSPPLDANGDNVFEFTTITIPVGVTVRLRASNLRNAPVHFLATGLVRIAGVLDLSGANGHPITLNGSGWGPSEPGPGGFPGGVGRTSIGSAANNFSNQDGFGPGAGLVSGGGWGLHATADGTRRASYGNPYLLPLVGGSGGAGSTAGGGAGGGAILIASATEIDLTSGVISVDGGNGSGSAWCGSGGAVRLLAPTIRMGQIQAACRGNNSTSFHGRVRLETNNLLGSPSITGDWRAVTLFSGTTLGRPLLPSRPAIFITAIGGQTVPPAPQASINAPDVTLSATTPMVVSLQAENIPLGTTVSVFSFNETMGSQTVVSSALTGSLANSSATATIRLDPGFTVVMAEAVW